MCIAFLRQILLIFISVSKIKFFYLFLFKNIYFMSYSISHPYKSNFMRCKYSILRILHNMRVVALSLAKMRSLYFTLLASASF